MQLITEHQFLVDIQDILPTWNVYSPLFLVHSRVVGYATHFLTEPSLSLLTVHSFRYVEQDVSTCTTHRTVHHVDTQLTLATHQCLGIQLWEVLATVQVNNRLA